jgi:hypothetical protein
MLFPKEKAVRPFGVSISGFIVGQTVRDERTALAILQRHRVQMSACADIVEKVFLG